MTDPTKRLLEILSNLPEREAELEVLLNGPNIPDIRKTVHVDWDVNSGKYRFSLRKGTNIYLIPSILAAFQPGFAVPIVHYLITAHIDQGLDLKKYVGDYHAVLGWIFSHTDDVLNDDVLAFLDTLIDLKILTPSFLFDYIDASDSIGIASVDFYSQTISKLLFMMLAHGYEVKWESITEKFIRNEHYLQSYVYGKILRDMIQNNTRFTVQDYERVKGVYADIKKHEGVSTTMKNIMGSLLRWMKSAALTRDYAHAIDEKYHALMGNTPLPHDIVQDLLLKTHRTDLAHPSYVVYRTNQIRDKKRTSRTSKQ